MDGFNFMLEAAVAPDVISQVVSLSLFLSAFLFLALFLPPLPSFKSKVSDPTVTKFSQTDAHIKVLERMNESVCFCVND